MLNVSIFFRYNIYFLTCKKLRKKTITIVYKKPMEITIPLKESKFNGIALRENIDTTRIDELLAYELVGRIRRRTNR